MPMRMDDEAGDGLDKVRRGGLRRSPLSSGGGDAALLVREVTMPDGSGSSWRSEFTIIVVVNVRRPGGRS
jgi:hypothetical protein